MIFNFDFNKFITYYRNLPSTTQPIDLIVFSKNYDIVSNLSNYKFEKKTVSVNIIHPILNNIYISLSNNSNYIYFHLPVTIDGLQYGNHFSIGLRDKKKSADKSEDKLLVDLHYTVQNPIKKESANSNTKCWLYDGKEINTTRMLTEVCEIPEKKRFIHVYNELFINYILIIIATPFIKTDKDKRDIKNVIKNIKSINSSIIAPPSSPTKIKSKVILNEKT
jgi:hypothetical protein